MTVKANGATLEWSGYQYARVHKGEVVETGDIDKLRARKRALKLPGKVMFQAVYVTDWMETTE